MLPAWLTPHHLHGFLFLGTFQKGSSKREMAVVDFHRVENVRVSQKREVLWGGKDCIVDFKPKREEGCFAKNGTHLPTGFVRLFDAETAKASEIPLYLHAKNANAVRRALELAKKGKIPCVIEVARNTYDNGVQISIDLFPAPAGAVASHTFSVVPDGSRIEATDAATILIPINGVKKAVFVARRLI